MMPMIDASAFPSCGFLFDCFPFRCCRVVLGCDSRIVVVRSERSCSKWGLDGSFRVKLRWGFRL